MSLVSNHVKIAENHLGDSSLTPDPSLSRVARADRPCWRALFPPCAPSYVTGEHRRGMDVRRKTVLQRSLISIFDWYQLKNNL